MKINFFLHFNLYIPHIYTNTPNTKNRNFPHLILSNPLHYGIVLILSLLEKYILIIFPNYIIPQVGVLNTTDVKIWLLIEYVFPDIQEP